MHVEGRAPLQANFEAIPTPVENTGGADGAFRLCSPRAATRVAPAIPAVCHLIGLTRLAISPSPSPSRERGYLKCETPNLKRNAAHQPILVDNPALGMIRFSSPFSQYAAGILVWPPAGQEPPDDYGPPFHLSAVSHPGQVRHFLLSYTPRIFPTAGRTPVLAAMCAS